MEENFGDNVEWTYTPFEQECIKDLETLPDPESEYEMKKNQYEERLWNSFQLTATAITRIYKGLFPSFQLVYFD